MDHTVLLVLYFEHIRALSRMAYCRECVYIPTSLHIRVQQFFYINIDPRPNKDAKFLIIRQVYQSCFVKI